MRGRFYRRIRDPVTTGAFASHRHRGQYFRVSRAGEKQSSEVPIIKRGEYRFGFVLLLLLATFMVLMAGSASDWIRPLSVALTGATLVAALFAADASPRVQHIALFLAVAAFVATLATVSAHGSGASGATAVLNAALVIVAPIAIARAVLRRRVIDVQTVLAALCIYVLFGLLWAFVFSAIGNLGSSAFFAQSVTPTSADYLYFSFITQLTIGYGDLTPAGNLGRTGAVIEGLVGELYLVTVVAVVVARLVPRGNEPAPSTNADTRS